MSGNRSRGDVPAIVRPTTVDDLRRIDASELDRYDALLAAIPLILLAAWIAGRVSNVPIWAALGVGGVVTITTLINGLVWNPPV